MDRIFNRRDSVVEPAASPLDHASQVSDLRTEGSGGHRRAIPDTSRGREPRGPERAEVVHGQKRRVADHDCAQTRREPDRSRRSEWPVDEGPGPWRTRTDYSPTPRPALRLAHERAP